MTAEFERETERELEEFFRSLKRDTEEASPDLLSRVLEDAYEEQDSLVMRELDAAEARPFETPQDSRRRGLLGGLLDAIGGWPAVAGLATATMAGIWIGYNPPTAFDGLTLSMLDTSYGYDLSIGDSLLVYDDLLADG